MEEKDGTTKTGRKIYIDKVAATRKELESILGSKEFFIDNKKYFVSQVKAMKSHDGTSTGMILGGFVGLFGGIAGVLASSLIGGILGKKNDIKEEEKVNIFNGSKL
ncbi:hypothetical protein [Providencia sp. PROV212]|uniref:hypothetical protein n=1 Tax=Providencia sp. PROV212 TaxID=2949909 RepID=UPI00234A4A5B|nr:hypothetical protein [Providencia sp. PROV212]